MLEKRFNAVPPQLFTADGQTNGTVTVSVISAENFKVKQTVILTATGLPNLTVQVKEVNSDGTILVGPFASPGVPSSLLSRTNVAAYTVALGAAIMADEQKRPSIDNSELTRAEYDEEPTVAKRVILVDLFGNKYTSGNPLPVTSGGGGLAPTKFDEVQVTYDANSNPTQYNFLLSSVSQGVINVTYDANGNPTDYKKA